MLSTLDGHAINHKAKPDNADPSPSAALIEKNAAAIVTGDTFKLLMKKAPLKDFLRDFDSFSAHQIASSLFYSGATGINLNDIRIAIVR